MPPTALSKGMHRPWVVSADIRPSVRCGCTRLQADVAAVADACDGNRLAVGLERLRATVDHRSFNQYCSIDRRRSLQRAGRSEGGEGGKKGEIGARLDGGGLARWKHEHLGRRGVGWRVAVWVRVRGQRGWVAWVGRGARTCIPGRSAPASTLPPHAAAPSVRDPASSRDN